jgi:hypothetical protein
MRRIPNFLFISIQFDFKDHHFFPDTRIKAISFNKCEVIKKHKSPGLFMPEVTLIVAKTGTIASY